MKTYYIFIIQLLIITINAGPSITQREISNSAITNTSVSKKCSELLKIRINKIKHKNRLLALLNRNKKLLDLTPTDRKSLKLKLIRNQRKLIYEIDLAKLKIKNKNENIIRSGCPGLKI